MPRRVASLVHDGLVRRGSAAADALSVVVVLTDAGLGRLTESAPVHVRAVSELFVAQLDDQELAVLESSLAKVTIDCTLAECRATGDFSGTLPHNQTRDSRSAHQGGD